MKTALMLSVLYCTIVQYASAAVPIVVNTWPTPNATDVAWAAIRNDQTNTPALDAVEAGCTYCEDYQCRGKVGFGGSPDENGETTLDAMLMDGGRMDAGAVGGLRRIKHSISVARHVLDHTDHTFIVGDLATNFAIENGFPEESLSTAESNRTWQDWKKENCQPNFRVNTFPDPKTSCGPYQPNVESRTKLTLATQKQGDTSENNHDTIGMIAIDANGGVVAGTSTNGLQHKIPGRVGDSPIPGAGGYADNDVGAAVATGNGDVMMRFLPTYQLVENMRRGMSPESAARDAMNRIVKHYSSFNGAIIGVSRDGEVGAACRGYVDFSYCVRSENMQETEIRTVTCGGSLLEANAFRTFLLVSASLYILSS